MVNVKNYMPKNVGALSFAALTLLLSSYSAYAMDPPVDNDLLGKTGSQPTFQAEVRDLEAQYGFAYTCYNNKDYIKAFESARVLADQHHVRSQFLVALMYENGLGVGKNEVQAFKYYMAAATQENSLAQAKVAVIYNDWGDQDNAFKYFKLAADQGHILSYFMAAKGYAYSGDQDNAFKYFKLAADHGDVDALYKLGKIYEKRAQERVQEQQRLLQLQEQQIRLQQAGAASPFHMSN